MERDIFQDIAHRTGGDIYLGVVGPMRSGKSTFIRRFMELFLLPNIKDEYDRERAVDAMPQAGAGRTIMTVEPKFIPEESVTIDLKDNLSVNVRIVDCTGFPVASAQGVTEDGEPRMVETPWFEEPIPLVQAAHAGTEKVISQHATIGIVVTTDGSIVGIPREDYVEAERETVEKLTEIGKPFVVVLNTTDPFSKASSDLAISMEKDYEVPVILANCQELNHEDIVLILEQVLYEFPVKEMTVKMPKWVQSLDGDHWLKKELDSHIKEAVALVSRVRDIDDCVMRLGEGRHVSKIQVEEVSMSEGTAVINLEASENSFLEVAGEKAETLITDKKELLDLIENLAEARGTYDKFRMAIRELEETGYGIVEPGLGEMMFEEPEMVKRGKDYGVRLKARGPVIHLIRTDVETSVNPTIGSQEQGEELVSYLMEKFEDDPKKIWATDLFGKPLKDLVLDGVTGKVARMPENARGKMQVALEKVVNEGSGGLICIIL